MAFQYFVIVLNDSIVTVLNTKDRPFFGLKEKC